MSAVHRVSLESRIGAFGVKVSRIRSPEELVAVACQLFGISAKTIDEAWESSQRMTKKERSRRARKAASNLNLPDPSMEPLSAELEERIIIARARAGISKLSANNPLRVAVEDFLRRPHWSIRC